MAVKGYSVNASYLLKPIQNQVLQYMLNKSINNVLSMHTKFFGIKRVKIKFIILKLSG